ncbi:MFS transporter [Paenibacillus sp. Root444D2]|nr:MFS transporter [Paenibacillus sp. Root444D2]
MRLVSDVRLFLTVGGAGMLLSIMLLYGIGTGILAPMNAIYLHDHLGLTKGEVVTVYSVSLLLNMITTISVGIVSDRIMHKKKLPLLAALICLAGLSFYMRADGFVGALIGMSIATAPSGLIMGQLFAMARNHFALKATSILEMSLVWLRGGFSAGFFLGLLLGANLYLLFGFQGVLIGNLSGYIGLIVILLLYKEVSPSHTKVARGKAEPFSLVMLLALLMLSCADSIRGLYLPLVVDRLFGKPQLMSYLWSAQAVFELLFMTITSYWAAKYGSKQIIALGSVFALLAYILYATAAPLPLFFAVQPFYSIYVSILYGVAMGVVQRMFVHRTGFGSSLYVFLTQGASLIGFLLPVLVKGISTAIFIIPIILVLCAILIIKRLIAGEKVVNSKVNNAKLTEGKS